MKRIVCLLLAVAMTAALCPAAFGATDMGRVDFEDILSSYSVNSDILPYSDYREKFPAANANAEIVINAGDFVKYNKGKIDQEPTLLDEYEGMSGRSVLTEEDGLIEFDFTAPADGFYDMGLTYYPIEGKSSEIQRAFFIDGELPYRELALVQFTRIWQNKQAKGKASADEIEWERDNQGNDLKPSMKESPEWITAYVYDSNGYVTEPLSVYLTAGEHTLSVHSLREPMLIRNITLSAVPEVPDYQTKLAEWTRQGAVDSTGQTITLEGEKAIRTSSQMLYPVQDQSSPSISPSSSKNLLNNSIGGNSWRLTGQWIEWEFDVSQAGFYNIGLHDKQNFKRGIYVSRKITIDGEVPFKEFEDYGFKYTQNWRYETLSYKPDPDKKQTEDYKIYLEPGKHTLRMEVVLGNFAEIISAVRDAVYDLNTIYRQVIRLTGVSPDKYRDYEIERSLPNLTAQMTEVRETLDWTIDELRRVAGRGSDRERVLITMRDQLVELIKDNEKFGKQVNAYKVNVRACGTWLNEAMNQPFQIDRIDISSPGKTVKLAKNSAFDALAFEAARLYYSFVIDYNAIGNVTSDGDQRTITLWIGSGRDQANVIKSLIDETFTNVKGVNVNVQLVDMSTLLQATLAGQGPDVAIQVAGDLPMNYGLRNAVADLAQFGEELNVVKRQFEVSAMTPYEYNGATYALPETQVFPMMFYRKDILNELGLDLPQTWEDINVVMDVLAQNQMELGMLPSEAIFTMMLYQNGGEYYNIDATRSALDSEAAINAFRKYTEFYTDYKLDRATSIEERFRTGETPIIIGDYTIYNNLQVSAPDLKGIWGMAPVPGTKKEDGTTDRSVGSYGGVLAGVAATTGNGGATVMMEASKHKRETWEFMKWWVSAETQIAYGREMESLMGSSARVPTANIEAFAAMPWPAEEYAALKEQFVWARGIPQVPGGYFTWRNVNNAFYSVTTPESDRSSGDTTQTTPREALTDRVILINDEIRYKRTEFKLPLD